MVRAPHHSGAILIALIYRMKIKTVKVVPEDIRIIQADIKNSVKIFFNKQLRWLLVIIGSLAVLLAIIFAVSNSGIVWFFMIMAYLNRSRSSVFDFLVRN